MSWSDVSYEELDELRRDGWSSGRIFLTDRHLAAMCCVFGSAVVSESDVGGIVTIDNSSDVPALSVISRIVASQSGAGDPSPDNVRPITGCDAVTLTRTGKNLLGFKDFSVGGESFIDSYSNGVFRREVINYHSTSYALGTTAFKNIENPHIPAGTYTFTLTHISGVTYASPYLEVTLSDGSMVNLASGVATTLPLDGTITGIRMTSKSFSKGDTIEFVMQLEAGAGTAYEPYNGVTLTTNLPETVYGGTLDWASGLLTVTHRRMVFDGTEVWESNATTNPGQFCMRLAAENRALLPGQICSHYKPGYAYTGLTFASIEARGTLIWLYHKDLGPATATLKSYLAEQAAAGTPVTLVYELATHYTIQLTPNQMEMLKGRNTVWGNTGDTSLVYVADTKMYIDGKFAELQNAILAQGANI